MTKSYRIAAAADQADPDRNPQFRRRWADAPPLRAWHADDAPNRFTSPQRQRAEVEWRALAGDHGELAP